MCLSQERSYSVMSSITKTTYCKVRILSEIIKAPTKNDRTRNPQSAVMKEFRLTTLQSLLSVKDDPLYKKHINISI